MCHKIACQIAPLYEFSILGAESLAHEKSLKTCRKKTTPLLYEARRIESIGIRRKRIGLSEYIEELAISTRAQEHLRIGSEDECFSLLAFQRIKKIQILAVVDVEGEELHGELRIYE